MSNYVLDACALLALLRNESGTDIVAAVFGKSFTDKITTGTTVIFP